MKKVWIVVVSLLLALNISLIYSLNTKQDNTKEDKESENKPSENQRSDASSFSFVGVGDNLIHDAIWINQQRAGQPFNFEELYSLTNKYTQNADLAFINSETPCVPGMPLSNYPMFNGPVEILDAVNKSGFDWIALSSNHSLDMGADGLIAQIQHTNTNYPDMLITGAHASQEDASTLRVKEINGIKVGILGYTYGLNGMMVPEDKPWLIDVIDKEKIRVDMETLSNVSDVQIVSMHWGQEYNTGLLPEQQDLANYLNELGAEVIIGHHPHVIEPAEIIKGNNQDTLVYYSLGNFVSAQNANDNMIGGMASFTLNYDFGTKKTSFSDVKFIPTVTYYDGGFNGYRTTTISEYTDEMAASHYVTTVNGEDLSRAYVQNYVQQVMGQPEGIELVLN